MWTISYDDRVLSVIGVKQPYKRDDRHVIEIITEGGETILAEYSFVPDADDAYTRFRRYAVRGGKTEAGTSLFIWPMERRADELSDEQLQEFARRTR